jgi:hypothetical protein
MGNTKKLLDRFANSTLALAVFFLLLILALNPDLFTNPLVEDGDFAVDSLLVHLAKHLHAFVGHDSRWQFHHPGPAFFYFFALGESLFYDLLHLVPAPFNAQLVSMIVVNIGLLLAAFAVLKRHCPAFSVPLGLAATLVISSIVNGSTVPSMLISIWQPDFLLFAYLLFCLSGASVLTGEMRDLPWFSFSGMLLLHAHIAQFLFVGCIGGGVLAVLLIRAAQDGSLKAFVRKHRRDITLATGICFVMALPPLLDLLLHRPNNLDDVLDYLHVHAGEQNGMLTAIRYVLSFFLFVGNTDKVLVDPSWSMVGAILSRPWVVIYWLTFFLSFLVAVALTRAQAARDRSPFFKNLLWIVGATIVLFLYWAHRITGPLYMFNGNFFFVVHVLAWFILIAAVSPRLGKRGKNLLAWACIAFMILFGVSRRETLRANYMPSNPDANPAASAVPILPAGHLMLTFEHKDWPLAAGVAMAMTRMGTPFCVNRNWGFMFDRARVCPDELKAEKLLVAAAGGVCSPPCRELYHGTVLSAMIFPVEELKLPVSIGQVDTVDIKTGFYESEGTHRWAQKHAAIRFLLASESPKADCLRLRLTGFAGPGGPAQFSLNGYKLGMWSKGTADSADFVVPQNALRPGQVNVISIDTEKAGPVGADPREIGFGFVGLVLRASTPGEGCASDASAQPEYSSFPADWVSGCYGLEGSAPGQWRWCGTHGSLVLRNQSTKAKRVTLSAAFSTGHDKPAPLHIHSPLFDESFTVNSYLRSYAKTLVLPPGEHTIEFTCDAAKADAPADPRTMVLRIDHFRAEAGDPTSDRATVEPSRISPLVVWGSGFYGGEAHGDDTWRWCQSRCELLLENDSSAPAPTVLSATLITGQKQPSAVRLGGSIFSKSYQAGSDGINIIERFVLPRGKYGLEFSTAAPRVEAPGDPRVLVLQVRNIRVQMEAPN